MKYKNITLSAFEVSKLKEFFHPKINQGLIFGFGDTKNVPIMLMRLGYPCTGENKAPLTEDSPFNFEDMWYCVIPSQFRFAEVQKTETVTW